jgi:hypothetical protein
VCEIVCGCGCSSEIEIRYYDGRTLSGIRVTGRQGRIGTFGRLVTGRRRTGGWGGAGDAGKTGKTGNRKAEDAGEVGDVGNRETGNRKTGQVEYCHWDWEVEWLFSNQDWVCHEHE